MLNLFKMSLKMYTMVGLSLLIVNDCHGLTTATLTCDQLPRVEVPHVETLKAITPLRFDYSLTSLWDCSTIEFSRPSRGVTSHHGTALIMQGTLLSAFEYSVESDKKTIYSRRCTNGEKRMWYFSSVHFDDNGGFYCLYSCNNTQLQEFGCASNNNGASPAELEAVKLARQVPNGHLIHNAWESCPQTNGCNVF